MTDIFVEDFKLGLDVRKSVITAQPGSLRTLDNCVITDGGEIEKRKAFVLVCDLGLTSVAGQTQGLHGSSVGLYGLNTDSVWVFSLGSTTLVGGTYGGNSVFACQPLPTIAKTTLVNAQPIQNPGLGPLTYIDTVEEYGAQQFFISGQTTPTTTGSAPVETNWWKGTLVPQDVGASPLVSQQKVYRLSGSIVYFSGVGDPSATNPLNPLGTGPNTVNPGAGFIDLSLIDSDAVNLVGIEAYYKQVAIFSRRCCILYSMDPDPAQNQFEQVLRVGAVSNGSILQYGTGDVLFLADNGVRSLRVQNISFAAGVIDVGSPIDKILQAAIAANAVAAGRSQAIVEPSTGRYWLSIANVIYVLSYWPSAKINAWSTFTLPFNVDHMTVAGSKVFVRSGDKIYQYGGVEGTTYDNCVATVITPFMSADTPTTGKQSISVGAMVQGNWSMSIGTQTDQQELFELVANLSGDTYSEQMLPFTSYGTHYAFTMTCTDAGPSLIGSLNVRFEKADES